ncbi:MAG TPA: prepilin peptidase [Syntrophus sp. (in: bacteria)]|nr:prepilin peptidase [Syntrophus sp. (in: bacteria)]
MPSDLIRSETGAPDKMARRCQGQCNGNPKAPSPCTGGGRINAEAPVVCFINVIGSKMDHITVFLGIVLIIASIEDVMMLRIPNWITLPGLAVGLSYFCLTRGYEGFLFSLAGGLTGLGLLIIPFIAWGTGAGDVKLMGAVGSVLGAHGVFIVFILSCVLGGVYALFLLASKGLLVSTFKRYGKMMGCFISTQELIYIPPTNIEKALRIRFGVVIALGTGSYLVLGF